MVSKSSKGSTTATSDTWKFYNSGPGIISYVPFPAEILSPAQQQKVTATGGKITLNWNASDVDNDIMSYDVYFDTKTTPALLKSGVTDMKYDVTVASGTTYYWQIVTKDSKGNTSYSGIYQFLVN